MTTAVVYLSEKPISNTQIFIVDKYLMPLPIGVVGELCIAGDGLARGYASRPDLTAETFLANPFSREPGRRLYKTGDLARFREDGNIEYVGRIDHQVKIRGLRIELGEIESVLAEQKGIREAVVVAKISQKSQNDSVDEQDIVAYIVLDDKRKENINKIDLRKALEEKLPDYMIPSFFVVLDKLPLSSNGKINRKDLPSPNQNNILLQNYIPPNSELQKKLAHIWSNNLSLPYEKISITAKFLELGGNSISATYIVKQINSQFDTKVQLSDVLNNNNIQKLAIAIEQNRESGELQHRSSYIPLRPKECRAPIKLSFSQQRLWFINEYEGKKDKVYTEPLVLELKGTLEVAALVHALKLIVNRHEILRTTFHNLDGEAVQVINNNFYINFPILNVGQNLFYDYIEEHVSQIFDLKNGPLVNIKIFRLHADRHILSINMHHIICDGWSTDVLGNELSYLYKSYIEGRASTLSLLPLQYADYSQWQTGRTKDNSFEKQLTYWKAHLSDAPTLLELPFKQPRPAVQSHSGARYHFDITTDLTKKIYTLSLESETTLHTTLLAGFAILLAKYSNQSDISVGIPVANRNQSGLEKLIGFFVNTLVIRTHVK